MPVEEPITTENQADDKPTDQPAEQARSDFNIYCSRHTHTHTHVPGGGGGTVVQSSLDCCIQVYFLFYTFLHVYVY